MKEPIDIVMTTWKRESITTTAINTLKKNTRYPYKLIIIDNGSDEWHMGYYAKEADIYVKLDKNYGLEYAKNIGMSFVDSDLFVSTDNDILVPRPDERGCWLTKLVNLMEDNPEYGAIALRPQVLVGTNEKDVFKDEDKEITEFTHVPGYMRIMDAHLTKELGAWNDKRPLRGHEEYWISERMRKLGRKVGWATNIRCYHLFGNKNWGYEDMKPEDHGHTPTNLPEDDWDVIERDFTG